MSTVTLGPYNPINNSTRVESKAEITYVRTRQAVDITIDVYLRRTNTGYETSGTVNVLFYISDSNDKEDNEISVSITGTTWIKYSSHSVHIPLGEFDQSQITVGYEINRTWPDSGAPEELEFDKYTTTLNIDAYNTSNFTPFVRIGGEWKDGSLFVKTADAWKRVANAKGV